MKKLVSVLLAVCLMAGLAGVGAISGQAAGTDEIIAVIAEHNLNHGGNGALVATVTGANEVTITGSVTGATEGLLMGALGGYIK